MNMVIFRCFWQLQSKHIGVSIEHRPLVFSPSVLVLHPPSPPPYCTTFPFYLFVCLSTEAKHSGEGPYICFGQEGM